LEVLQFASQKKKKYREHSFKALENKPKLPVYFSRLQPSRHRFIVKELFL
jgi:hypothetical protein